MSVIKHSCLIFLFVLLALTTELCADDAGFAEANISVYGGGPASSMSNGGWTGQDWYGWSPQNMVFLSGGTADLDAVSQTPSPGNPIAEVSLAGTVAEQAGSILSFGYTAYWDGGVGNGAAEGGAYLQISGPGGVQSWTLPLGDGTTSETFPSSGSYTITLAAWSEVDAPPGGAEESFAALNVNNFDITPVPEPSPLVVLGSGAAILAAAWAWRRWRRWRSESQS